MVLVGDHKDLLSFKPQDLEDILIEVMPDPGGGKGVGISNKGLVWSRQR